MKKLLSVVILVVILAPVVRGEMSYEPVPTPGKWSNRFLDAKEYSDSHHVPLVYFWSSYEKDGSKCHYCKTLEDALDTAAVEKRMAKLPYVFCHTWAHNGKDDACNEGGFGFASTAAGEAKKKVTEWPIICLYWPHGGKVEAVNFVGRKGRMPKTKGTLADQFMDSVEDFFKNYVADPSGRFACGSTEYDRLEAESTTTSVWVPLTRTGDAVDFATSNRVKAVFHSGATQSIPVLWAEGENSKEVKIDLSGDYAAGQSVSLSLYNEEGDLVDTNAILYVKDKANSPANPLWIGERTAQGLCAGEWTMDLEVAQRRSAALKKNTLVIVAGSKWCPDCVNTDRNLMDTGVFKDWASENGVSCVAIDVPMMGSDCPSLLSPKAYDCSWLFGMTSGMEYLSRKGVPQIGNGGTNATAVAVRNHDLLYNDTLHGGLCRPECTDDTNPETGKFKTGIPCLILQDSNARILGRLYQFNNVSPTDTSAAAAYVQRLKELAALEGDGTEELNRDWSTVSGAVCQLAANGAAVQSDISAIDTSDYWKLTGIGTWVRGTIKVKGLRQTGTSGEQNARLTIWKVSNKKATKVMSKTGNLYTGFSLSNVQMTATDDWFAQLESIETSTAFALDSSFDSRVGYTLGFTTVADPGTAAFVTTAATVKESDIKKAKAPSVEVRAITGRTGGGSGTLTVPVKIDASTTAEPDRYELVDKEVKWADSDMAEKPVRITVFDNPSADGTQKLVLRIGESRFTLTIIDDDKSSAGKISITESAPAIAKKGTVIATEGETVRIGVSRISGASGVATAKLTADAGEFADKGELVWPNRVYATIWRELKLPSLDEAPKSGQVTVKLASVTGAKADSSGKSLKIQLVAADAPCFAVNRKELPLERYVRTDVAVDILKVAEGSKVSVKKLSGSLPSGLSVSATSTTFWISGAPTCKAGSYTAVYQVSTKVGRKTTPGLTLEVVCTVTDFTSLPDDDPGANPSVAKARTLSSLLVVDEATRTGTGLLQSLSINQRGKLSAKYKTRTGTVSLSCPAWDEYSRDTGTLRATLFASKSSHSLCVTAERDGKVEVGLYDPDLPEHTFSAVMPGAWDAKNTAEAWSGMYTVDFHSPTLVEGDKEVAALGDAILTCQMTKSADIKKGTMKYAGVLPSGKTFSGSSILVRTDDPDAVALPVVRLASGDFFSAAPQLLRKSSPDRPSVFDSDFIVPKWVHEEAKTAEGDYAVIYLTAGSRYDASADFAKLAIQINETDQRVFEAENAVDPVGVTIKKASVEVDSVEAKPCKLKLKFAPKNGMVSGSFKFKDEFGDSHSATFKGVVLPEWDGCPKCGDRPWAAGAFWYSDKLTYQQGKRTKSLTIKRGGTILVEIENYED